MRPIDSANRMMDSLAELLELRRLHNRAAAQEGLDVDDPHSRKVADPRWYVQSDTLTA
jgi:hypothetical protein